MSFCSALFLSLVNIFAAILASTQPPNKSLSHQLSILHRTYATIPLSLHFPFSTIHAPEPTPAHSLVHHNQKLLQYRPLHNEHNAIPSLFPKPAHRLSGPS